VQILAENTRFLGADVDSKSFPRFALGDAFSPEVRSRGTELFGFEDPFVSRTMRASRGSPRSIRESVSRLCGLRREAGFSLLHFQLADEFVHLRARSDEVFLISAATFQASPARARRFWGKLWFGLLGLGCSMFSLG
jgi:hypothetical protein